MIYDDIKIIYKTINNDCINCINNQDVIVADNSIKLIRIK